MSICWCGLSRIFSQATPRSSWPATTWAAAPRRARPCDQLGVGGRTIFTGLLEGRARLELLADADVVVYPSEHEIFGLVPLEALLAGTPVVVANDSGCGEVVAAMGGGLVVEGNAAALRSAIDHILAAPAHWRAAAAEAARRIRATCATDVVCAQLEELYRDMVAAR